MSLQKEPNWQKIAQSGHPVACEEGKDDQLTGRLTSSVPLVVALANAEKETNWKGYIGLLLSASWQGAKHSVQRHLA